jgi:hypothetical protein
MTAASPATLYWDLTRRQAALLGAILVATIAIYLPSLRNGWVWDDRLEIIGGGLLNSWAGIGKSFRYDSLWFLDPAHLPQSGYYRPLQASWFALNYMILGNHPAAWHLEKIVLELIAVMLSFRLAQLITRSTPVALLTAAVFGLLPASVEPVVWTSAIGEPLVTIFEMGALCCFINRKPGSGLSRGLVFALVLYACALLSHETAILFPLIVAAYVFLFEGGSVGAAEPAETRPRMVSALRACAPFVLVLIAYLCARINALGVSSLMGIYRIKGSVTLRGMLEPRPHHGPAQILMTLPVVLITYLAVLALPGMAGPAHFVEWITHPQPLVFIYAAALVLIGVAALALAWRSSNRRIYLFCAAWSFLAMAPALNLNALWWLVDDHYLYAPSFGWSLAVAAAVLQIAAAGSRARKTVGAAMAVLLVLDALWAMKIERYWHDDVTYFQRCVEIAPYNLDYRVGLVIAMNKAGDSEGAAQALERGTTLEPNELPLHLKLAQQYQMMGREQDFEREFRKFNELSEARVRRQRAAASGEAASAAPSP